MQARFRRREGPEDAMDQTRILILGQTKENSYEIRNLLDNRRFELEIALNRDIGKQILSSRKMDLVILHTEVVDESLAEFFEYLDHEGIEVPMMLLGEEANRLKESLPHVEASADEGVKCFEKPYPVDEMIRYIREG